jgi:DHA2 family multidrug resistance protein
MMSAMGPDWGFWELFWPQAVRGAAVLLTMVSVVGMALKDMTDEELKDASGFNNLLRNLGGAVGIAAVNTWLIAFTQGHAMAFNRALGRSAEARDAIAGMALRFAQSGLAPAQGQGAAAATAMDQVARQSLTLAFDDVFRISAWLFLACLVFLPFCSGGPMTQRHRAQAH